MSTRRIFCAGPDDRSALRELIGRGGFSRTLRKPVPAEERGRTVFIKPGSEDLEITIAGDDDRVPPVALDVVFAHGSPSEPVHLFGLSFDPEERDETAWRRAIETTFREQNPIRIPGADGYALTGPFGPVTLLPLPWWDPAKAHPELTEKQCLERIAGHALATVHPNLGELVDQWLPQAREAGRPPSWKMAARFWNGLVHADASGAGFFDKVFGQDHALGEGVRRALQGSMLWRGLEQLCA